ncbi:MAG: hypothetical protein ACK45R_09000 [Candidatus Kapaibacterium sp.]
MIHTLKSALNAIAIAASCMCTLALQAQNLTASAARDTAITRPLYGNMYFGIQAGVLLSVGARIRYINSTERIPSWYADAEADVGFLSELRAGAGTFLTKHWYVGTKAGYSLAWETAGYKTLGIEIGYAIPFGSTASSVLLIDGGVAFVLGVDQVGPQPPERPVAIPMNIRFCYQGKLF